MLEIKAKLGCREGFCIPRRRCYLDSALAQTPNVTSAQNIVEAARGAQVKDCPNRMLAVAKNLLNILNAIRLMPVVYKNNERANREAEELLRKRKEEE